MVSVPCRLSFVQSADTCRKRWLESAAGIGQPCALRSHLDGVTVADIFFLGTVRSTAGSIASGARGRYLSVGRRVFRQRPQHIDVRYERRPD